MYASVFLGDAFPLAIPKNFMGIPDTGVWTILLLIYAYIASTIPVTTLLQPRDYINAWQLIVAMGLMVFGIIVAGLTTDLHIVAPAYNPNPQGAPPLLPFIFITIACGAISGFHSLVSSGTTSKQLKNETDALSVGYGSMIMESVLAVLVLIAVSAGIGMKYSLANGEILKGVAAWNEHYSSWGAVTKGLGAKLSAFICGSANMIETLGIPNEIAVIVLGVFVASFAGTTLDTATRLQRYIISEMMVDMRLEKFSGKYISTFLAVASAAALAFATGAGGVGAMKLWPMFGAVNQLLATLGLLVVTVYLKRKYNSFQYLLTALPCMFMLSMTLWATIINELNFINRSQVLLAVVNGFILLLVIWMVIESVLVLYTTKK
jgi:carbon starvation protein